MPTRLIAAGLILGMVGIACAAAPAINTTRLPDDVRAEQVQSLKWGMFICWSFSTFAGQEWTPTRGKDASYFKATGCDTDQWCQTARDAGMGYILFLSKHHDGFCLWDTKTTDKKVTNSPLGIDVLAQLRKSCDRYGIKLALYFSEGDWNWPGSVDGKGGRTGGGSNPEVKKAQLKELLTGYGPIEFWWMDHAVGTGGLSHPETVAWMHRFQPNTFVGFNHGDPAGRLCLRERGRPGKLGDKDASKYNKGAEGSFKGYRVAEFTYPILPPHKGGAQWFYSLPKHDNLCHPAAKVYKDYQGAMQHGNIFSINIGPNYAGRIRDVDVRTLGEVGQMIRAGRAGQSVGKARAAEDAAAIDAGTVTRWSAPYRGWHHYPDHVIPAKPSIKGHETVRMTDVPTVFQRPGDKRWYMTFIGFDGKGYQSFVAESEDLLHWTNMRLAMGYGPEGSFDHGGVVLGAYLYDAYGIKAPRVLKKYKGRFFTLYGAYPRQGGYELRPGYEGVAASDDGLLWRRAKDEPILSVHQPDCGPWEKDCIYQPWLVEHQGKFHNFYNAANGHVEQMGLALSDDLLAWKRYARNPVIPNGPKGSYNEKFSSDGKVFRDGDHWVGFFFGVGRGGAHVMTAFSRDLYHWTVDPDPIYKAGGNPSGLDQKYAHKVSLVWNPVNDSYYMFYCAVGNKGRGIGLIASKPLDAPPQPNTAGAGDTA